MEEFRAGMAAPLPERPGFFSGMTMSGMTQKAGRERMEREQGEDREVMAEYQSALAERSALAQRPPGSAQEQAEQGRRIADLDRRLQAMQQQMQMRAAQREPAAKPQRGREQRAALLKNVQARVPEGAVLLEMLKYRPLDPRVDLAEEKRWGAARYGTYVIRRSGEPVYVDLGEAEPIERLVTSFRAALSRQDAASRGLGRQLDALLMQPVRERLGGATLVLVAPEDLLNLVPFGALVDEQNRYLVERFTFTYLASGRDLLRESAMAPRGPALIIADPAFGSQGTGAPSGAEAGGRSRNFDGLSFERLPGTASEAQALKRILAEAVVLTGDQATETVAKQSKGPRILHIATHGFFLENASEDPAQSGTRSSKLTGGAAPAENPMLRSGLVFAGVNALRSGDDDGVLTALEASALDLAGTKLVVLSACETGLGQVRNGEGVFGLRRAFTVAGAESLLMSLWQVADEATKDLMIGYYTRLAKGEGRAEALRQTQLAMLKDPKLSHPFFWASFIPSGEWGSLK
jgi:CHAT domain-containing protein